jgi:tRNA1Val (adenine37-N6)-methyltransferase
VKETSDDTISLRGAGIISLRQPKKGNRFTLDSLLLADFCRIKPRDRVLEPGAGVGIISILLAKKFPLIRVTAVEVQPAAADLCRFNIAQNNLAGRICILEHHIKKLKTLFRASPFDVIIANPPYTRSGTGWQSPRTDRLLSRHEHLTDLNAWIALQTFLKNKGRYLLVFSAFRCAEVISALRANKLEPKRIRFVHSYRNIPAHLVLIEAMKSAGVGLQILSPLIVHKAEGEYSEEMQSIYGMEPV